MADFITITCHVCSERFGLSQDTYGVLKRSGRVFCCPFGHEAVFAAGKTEAQKLREELERERRDRQRAAQQVEYWAQEAKKERNRANGYKGHATRITKRAKAGVCICCNRSFKDLARHMASKHPTLTPIDIEQGATMQ